MSTFLRYDLYMFNKQGDTEKPTKRRPKTPLAERLDAAATAVGATNEDIAADLGVTAGAVGHWRKGRNEPDIATIQAYARRVRQSDYYLLTGRPDPAWLLAQIPAALDEFKAAVLAGEEPITAWERILARDDVLTDEQRDQLIANAAGLREYLASPAGAAWGRLSEEEQRFVQDLVRLLARERGPQPEVGSG